MTGVDLNKISVLVEQLRDIVTGRNTYNNDSEYIDNIVAITRELTTEFDLQYTNEANWKGG